MRLARCDAEPGKMFVGSASKKPDAAIGGTEIGRKFCRQCNKRLQVEEITSLWLCQMRIPKN